MKIFIATPQYPPRHIGGSELIASRTARALARRGHAVEVACVESTQAGVEEPFCQTEQVEEGVILNRLHIDLNGDGQGRKRVFDNPRITAWMSQHFAENPPDVVHLLSGYLITAGAVQAAKQAGLPVLVTLLDFWFVCPRITLLRTGGQLCAEPVPADRCAWCYLTEQRRYRLVDEALGGLAGNLFTRLGGPGAGHLSELVEERRRFHKAAFEQADAVITHSRFLDQKVRSYGLTPRESIYLPNGIPHPALVERLERKPGAALRIGFTGQAAPHKGAHVLIEAFRRAFTQPGQAELHIYGDLTSHTVYTASLQKLAAGRGDIHFHGAYRGEEVGRILSALDVVVVPSLWFENRPTVILEAQAAGIPAVVSRLGGMTELVRDGVDGLLFTPADAGDLARALQRLAGEAGLWETLRSNQPVVPDLDGEVDVVEQIYFRLAGQTRQKE